MAQLNETKIVARIMVTGAFAKDCLVELHGLCVSARFFVGERLVVEVLEIARLGFGCPGKGGLCAIPSFLSGMRQAQHVPDTGMFGMAPAGIKHGLVGFAMAFGGVERQPQIGSM